MATKIFYNDNRIIIDGHADSAEECKAITAMCDELANSENFKTIVYEEGHAVFEQINGGDSEMFAALEAQIAALKQQVAAIKSCECDMSVYLSKNEAGLTYETKTAHEASIALLQNTIDKINTTLGHVDTTKGSVADQLNWLNLTIVEVQNLAEKAIKLAEESATKKTMSDLAARISALETSPKVPLNYTAQQLNTLLAKVESL